MADDRRIILRGIARELIAVVSGVPNGMDTARRLRRCARMLLAVAGSITEGGE